MRHVSHRPYALPSEPWTKLKKLKNLIFNHWALDPELLERYLPHQLKLDTFKGKGYITITSLEVSDVKLRNLPFFPIPSHYFEVNVKTYVIYKNIPGIYYFSLDVSSWWSVLGAKLSSNKPYFNADIIFYNKGDGSTFVQSKRKNQPPAEFIISYTPDPDSAAFEPAKKTLEHWLMERYSIFRQVKGNFIHRKSLHHLPWKIQKVTVDIKLSTMTFPLGLILDTSKSLTYYACEVDQFYWEDEKII